jgi:hypothetical protein
VAAAKKAENELGRCGASSGLITNPKQSILETFDIYGLPKNNNQLKTISSAQSIDLYRTYINLCSMVFTNP